MTGEHWDHGLGKDAYYTEGGFDSMINFSTTDGNGLGKTQVKGSYQGYADKINFEVIEYGNPDNSEAGDLTGHNQVYLRAEAWIGWAILDGSAFARIETASSGS